MYTIFLGIGIGFIVGFIVGVDFFDRLSLGLWLAIIGFSIAAAIATTTIPDQEKVLLNTYELETLQDARSLSVGGNFLYMSINRSMEYVFYFKNENDEYKLGEIYHKKAVIKYREGIPTLEEYGYVRSKSDYNKKWAHGRASKTKSYIFYVPKGTIKNNISLDAS